MRRRSRAGRPLAWQLLLLLLAAACLATLPAPASGAPQTA